MKITFIVPPPLDNEKPAERTAGCTRVVYPMPNIYELIVAGLLEAEGYDVAYRDFALDKYDQRKLEEFLLSDQSDCYLIWTVNLSIQTDVLALQIIRKHRENAQVLFLGPGATYFPQKLVCDNNVIAVRGEPEQTVKEVIGLINSRNEWRHCKGISYLKDGSLCNNPSRPLITDLDILPFPARHFIEKYHFSNPKLKAHPYTTVLTSRNCPFQCIYCVPSSLTFAREIEYKKENRKKPPVSFRSVGNIIAELDLLAQSGYKSIAFIDDNFIVSAKRLRPICEAVKKTQLQMGLSGQSRCHYGRNCQNTR